jgi:hypothetical protein
MLNNIYKNKVIVDNNQHPMLIVYNNPNHKPDQL